MARFISKKAGTANGAPATIVTVAPAGGTGTLKVAVSDREKEMGDFVDKLQLGDYVLMTCVQKGRNVMVGRIETYNFRPGEDTPGVFLFKGFTTETVKKKDVTTVRISRFGAETALTVPMAKNAQGKMAPKEELMKVITSLKQEDMVTVVTSSGTLNSIRLYETPQLAEFIKLGKETVHDVEVTSVQVAIDGNTQTLLVDKKNNLVLSKLHSFKANNLVYVRTTTDDDGTKLLEIRPAPKGTKLPDDKK